MDLSLCVCLFPHKSVPCMEMAQDVPCQLRDWAGVFLEGCYELPACVVHICYHYIQLALHSV